MHACRTTRHDACRTAPVRTEPARTASVPGGQVRIEPFFDPATATLTYLVLDIGTNQCALIDAVLDYDPTSGRTRTDSAARVIERVRLLDARVQWILETHVHADHLSAAGFLKDRLGGSIGIGSRVIDVQRTLGALFNAGADFACDGSQFDRLFEDGDCFRIGSLSARALHTPGHTPACISYLIGDAPDLSVFVGDTLLPPDEGTARCDFPGADARVLYRSINRLLSLPTGARLHAGHVHRPGNRGFRFRSTVAEQRQGNVHVRDGISEEAFVTLRAATDATMAKPPLILPSVQVNMRAGRLPDPEPNGTRYLKIPLDAI